MYTIDVPEVRMLSHHWVRDTPHICEEESMVIWVERQMGAHQATSCKVLDDAVDSPRILVPDEKQKLVVLNVCLLSK